MGLSSSVHAYDRHAPCVIVEAQGERAFDCALCQDWGVHETHEGEANARSARNPHKTHSGTSGQG